MYTKLFSEILSRMEFRSEIVLLLASPVKEEYSRMAVVKDAMLSFSSSMGRSKGSLYALMSSGGSAGVGGSIEIFGDLSSREVLRDEGDLYDCEFESNGFDTGDCSPSVTMD